MSEIYKGAQKVKQPSPEFEKNITKLAAQSKLISDSMQKPGSPRKWQMGNHEEKDPHDYSSVRETFSRKSLDELYKQVYSEEPGSNGDVIAIKMQAAYLQAMERAFRLRHSSIARNEAFSSGPRNGHGDQKGPLLNQNGVLGYITQVIQLASTSPK